MGDLQILHTCYFVKKIIKCRKEGLLYIQHVTLITDFHSASLLLYNCIQYFRLLLILDLIAISLYNTSSLFFNNFTKYIKEIQKQL